MAESVVDQGLRQLIQAKINRETSDKLGNLTGDLVEFLPKGMNDNERAEVRLALLDMIEESTKVFFKKMRSRIETARIASE